MQADTSRCWQHGRDSQPPAEPPCAALLMWNGPTQRQHCSYGLHTCLGAEQRRVLQVAEQQRAQRHGLRRHGWGRGAGTPAAGGGGWRRVVGGGPAGSVQLRLWAIPSTPHL